MFPLPSEFPTNLLLPRLTGKPSDIPSLIVATRDLQQKELASVYSVDFSDVQACAPAALVLIGAALRSAEARGSTISIRTASIRPDVYRLLRQNGFLTAFGVSERVDRGTAISYREDTSLDVNSIVDYLTFELLASDFLGLARDAQGEIAGALTEIYVNAFDHAKSPVGVVSCGHYNRRMNRVQFAAVDIGSGIGTSVRQYMRKQRRFDLDDVGALEWAFEQGHTTKPGNEPRGNGLGLLRDFIRRYKGFMEIRSNGARVLIRDGKSDFQLASTGIHGTLARITLDCDRRLFVRLDKRDDRLEF